MNLPYIRLYPSYIVISLDHVSICRAKHKRRIPCVMNRDCSIEIVSSIGSKVKNGFETSFVYCLAIDERKLEGTKSFMGRTHDAFSRRAHGQLTICVRGRLVLAFLDYGKY